MESPHKGKIGLKHLWNVFHSLAGFSTAFKNEDAFRQESLLALVLIPMALSACGADRQGRDDCQRPAGTDYQITEFRSRGNG